MFKNKGYNKVFHEQITHIQTHTYTCESEFGIRYTLRGWYAINTNQPNLFYYTDVHEVGWLFIYTP